nr:MAG TPA: hypothetical protein [Caudoviricetes sp.]
MKTFFYTAKYILKNMEDEYKEYTDHGIVADDSYAEAMSQLEKFYDPEDLYELKLSSLRDGGIVFLPELPNVNLEDMIIEENIC